MAITGHQFFFGWEKLYVLDCFQPFPGVKILQVGKCASSLCFWSFGFGQKNWLLLRQQ